MEKNAVGIGIWLTLMAVVIGFVIWKLVEHVNSLLIVYGIVGLTGIMGVIFIIYGLSRKGLWED